MKLRLKRFAGIAAIGCATLLAAQTAGLAAQRPDVTRMTCAQARDLIASRGAVVVTTGQHTYSRFVAGARFCDPGERHLHPAFTPTADQRSCSVGFTCESWSLYFPDDD